jgi:hypothetical protein
MIPTIVPGITYAMEHFPIDMQTSNAMLFSTAMVCKGWANYML